jgi:hypothetical protein
MKCFDMKSSAFNPVCLAAAILILLLSAPGADAPEAQGAASYRSTNPYGEDVIVFTANQEFLSRIYILRLDGTVITYFPYDFYRFCDLEVVNNEVYAAEAFAPRLYKIDIGTGDIETIIDDWSLYYFYDAAFDGTYFYTTEWDLNRYDINGVKDGTAGFDENVFGGAWDGAFYWTLTDEDLIKCWDISGWPALVEVSDHHFLPPTQDCRGLWFDGEYFWTAESLDGMLGKIYQFEHDGTIRSEWTEPAFAGWGACLVRAEPDDRIVDNSDPAFTILAGTWKTANYSDAQGGDLRFNPAGSGANRAGWRVDGLITLPGMYDVFVWKFDHPYSHLMAEDARYIVRFKNGLSGWILVDQSSPGDAWIPLGNFEFDGSHPQGVMLTDAGGGHVIADAIKLVYTGAP